VVRLYPPEQTEVQGLYWWSYPPAINDYLVSYAEENKLPVKRKVSLQ